MYANHSHRRPQSSSDIMDSCMPLGVERTPDPSLTRLVIGAQNPTQDTRPEIPDPIECQGPDIKDNCLFNSDCTIFFMSTVPEF